MQSMGSLVPRLHPAFQRCILHTEKHEGLVCEILVPSPFRVIYLKVEILWFTPSLFWPPYDVPHVILCTRLSHFQHTTFKNWVEPGDEARVWTSWVLHSISLTVCYHVVCVTPLKVVVPQLVAMTLSYPERVTKFNIDFLRRLVINGPDRHPGANFIQQKDQTFKK